MTESVATLTLQDSRLTYDLAPLLWETTIVGTGSCTHLPNESAAMTWTEVR